MLTHWIVKYFSGWSSMFGFQVHCESLRMNSSLSSSRIQIMIVLCPGPGPVD